MHVIGDGERDLRHAGLPGQLVGADADQPAVLPGQQRRMLGIGLAADPPGFLLGRARAHAEKPQVHVVRRHGSMHRAHRLKILRPGRPDLHRAAVGQQRVRGHRWRAHLPAPHLAVRPRPGTAHAHSRSAHRSAHQVPHGGPRSFPRTRMPPSAVAISAQREQRYLSPTIKQSTGRYRVMRPLHPQPTRLFESGYDAENPRLTRPGGMAAEVAESTAASSAPPRAPRPGRRLGAELPDGANGFGSLMTWPAGAARTPPRTSRPAARPWRARASASARCTPATAARRSSCAPGHRWPADRRPGD